MERSRWILAAALLALAVACDGAAERVAPAAVGQTGAPGARDPREHERLRMVAEQVASRGIEDPRVLEAMRRVPRHRFVPESCQDDAYADHPLPIGHGQTISQPYIVAFMTEALRLRGGEKVLEIGTGSGYQAAVLAELGCEVYTMEIVEPLAREAGERLRALGYERVHVRAGDGYRGWPEAAPFDAVIVTAAPDHVPQPLVEQLMPGGRLVLPVGDLWQELVLVEKTADGTVQRDLLPVRFVPMTGKAERR